MAFSLDLVGHDVMASRLITMSNVVGEVSDGNMDTACRVLEQDVKDRAPVDTGHLMRSYDHTVRSRGGRTVGHVGTNVEYAIYQEFGTRHMSAQPHFRPAIDAQEDTILDIIGKETIRGAIDQA